MQWYWWIVIMAAAITVFWISFSLCMLKAVSMPRRTKSDSVRRKYRDMYGIDIEYFYSAPKTPFEIISHNTVISGEIYIQSGANKTVIISHGFMAERTATAHYAKMYMDMGYNVAVYDQRYFGKSGGRICTMGYLEKDDLIAVSKKVKELAPDTALILHGESMGAATVLMAASDIEGLLYVVSDCAFSDAGELFRHIVKSITHMPFSFPIADLYFLWTKLIYGYRPDGVIPADAVKNAEVPILFIHGAEDKYVPVRMSQQMFTLAKNPLTELYLAENAKHALSYYVNPQKYIRIVSDFDQKISNNMIHKKENI